MGTKLKILVLEVLDYWVIDIKQKRIRCDQLYGFVCRNHKAQISPYSD